MENEGLKQKQADIRRKVVVCNEKANILRDELKSAKLKLQDLEKESEDHFNLSLDIGRLSFNVFFKTDFISESLKRRSEKAENKVVRELQEKCERLKEQLKYRNVSYKILQDQMNQMEVRSRETSKTDEEKILNSSSKISFHWFLVSTVFSCNILIFLFILSFLLFRLAY